APAGARDHHHLRDSRPGGGAVALRPGGRDEGRARPPGRIPKELYERPRTRFVADFVGTNNLVPGEVQERRGDQLVVDTALGRLRAIPSGAVGGRCVLAIRPENVAIGAAGDGNVVPGRISFVSYLGNTLRYDVEARGGQ